MSAYCFVMFVLIAGTAVLSEPPNCEIVQCVNSSVCRYVEPCANCQLVPKCVPVAEIGEVDQECKSQNYSEAILATTDKSVSYKSRDCLQGCPKISKCVHADVNRGSCCRVRINPAPSKQKKGNCPTGSNPACGGVLCLNDDDCPDDLKCCQSCGNRCAKPAIPPTTTTTTTTTTTKRPKNICGGKSCPKHEICVWKHPSACQSSCTSVPTCLTSGCVYCKDTELCKNNKCEPNPKASYSAPISALSWFLVPIPFMLALSKL